MIRITELVVLLVLITSFVIGGCAWYVVRGGRVRSVTDGHHHRWTKWAIVAEKQVHTYGQVDEGRDLPDRIDAVLRRECVRCGFPETKTMRGLRSTYKG